MLNIQEIEIDKIKPYERNNKKHPKHQIDKLAKQIEAHKFDVPIVVDENHVIIKGHGRLLAAKKLKMKTVPCIVRSDLSEAQKKAARIADNKLGEIAEVDLDNLKFEMEELKNVNFDVDLTGFDNWSLDGEIKEETKGLTDPDDVPELEETKETRCKPGDIWIFDPSFHCSDCGKRYEYEEGLAMGECPCG